MQKINPKASFLLKLLMTVALFGVILQGINFEELQDTVRDAYIPIFVFMCVLWFFTVWISVVRWRVFLREYHIPIPLRRLYQLYLIGTFFNNFLPTGFGGDGYKFYKMNQSFPGKKKDIISSMILERGFGFLSMFFLVLVMGLVFFSQITSNITLLTIFLTSIFIVTTFVSFIIFYPTIKALLPQRVLSFPLLKKGFQLIETLRSIHSPRMMIQALGYSLVFTGMGVFSIFLCFQAFQEYVPISTLVFLVPMINLTALIPISLNSLGVREGAAIFLFGVFGIAPEIVLPVYLINRFLLILLSLSGGLVYLFEKKNLRP